MCPPTKEKAGFVELKFNDEPPELKVKSVESTVQMVSKHVMFELPISSKRASVVLPELSLT